MNHMGLEKMVASLCLKCLGRMMTVGTTNSHASTISAPGEEVKEKDDEIREMQW